MQGGAQPRPEGSLYLSSRIWTFRYRTRPPAACKAIGPRAYWIKVSAQEDGTFTVTNARNGFSKVYRPAIQGGGRP